MVHFTQGFNPRGQSNRQSERVSLAREMLTRSTTRCVFWIQSLHCAVSQKVMGKRTLIVTSGVSAVSPAPTETLSEYLLLNRYE